MPDAPTLRRLGLAAAAAAILAVSACSSPGTPAPARSSAPARASASAPGPTTGGAPGAARPPGNLLLYYTGLVSDGKALLDSGGRGTRATIRTGGGGTITPVTENGNTFFRFPSGVCLTAPCPQAIIQPDAAVDSAADDNGTGRFAFGVDVRLTQPPTHDAGMNLIQFGTFGSGKPGAPGVAQWKLQADYGRPSCRWSDGKQSVLLFAGQDDFRLSVGRWYRLTCERLGSTRFQIRVEDAVTGQPVVPPKETTVQLTDIVPKGTVTIGGKRIKANQADGQTDQFHGDMDNIELGRR